MFHLDGVVYFFLKMVWFEAIGLDVPYKAMNSAADFAAWLEKDKTRAKKEGIDHPFLKKDNQDKIQDDQVSLPTESSSQTEDDLRKGAKDSQKDSKKPPSTETVKVEKEKEKGSDSQKPVDEQAKSNTPSMVKSDGKSGDDEKNLKISKKQSGDPDEMQSVKGSKGVINKTYRVGRKLGAGAFGDIYSGVNMHTNVKVAIKMERQNCASPQVLFEAGLYSEIGSVRGIPKVHWAGPQGDYTTMILDVLGPSLDDLFHYCKRRFSLKTLLMLSDQMFAVIEYLHQKCYIHRDIKPSNFLMGLNKDREQMYIIDFGLAKRYYDAEEDVHNPMKEGKGLVGTAKFASVNSHMGIELSRRDDLEAIGYVLVYFLRGSLPWQGLGVRNTKQQMHMEIMKKKLSTSVEDLCRVAPREFVTYFEYIRLLTFEEKPDYGYVRDLFKTVWTRYNFELDFAFDWTQRASDRAKEKKDSVSPRVESSTKGSKGDGSAVSSKPKRKGSIIAASQKEKTSKAPDKGDSRTSEISTFDAKDRAPEKVLPQKMAPRRKLFMAREHFLHNSFPVGTLVRQRRTRKKGVVVSEFMGTAVIKFKDKEEIQPKDEFEETQNIEETVMPSELEQPQDIVSNTPAPQENSIPQHEPAESEVKKVEEQKVKKKKLIKVKVKAKPRNKSLWKHFFCKPCIGGGAENLQGLSNPDYEEHYSANIALEVVS